MQVHEDRNVTNTLEERTQGTICLGPKNNLQGTYIHFSLHSDKKTTQRKFTEMPNPLIVIKQVAAMELSEKKNKGMIFENRTGAMVNYILPDNEANNAFNILNGNITGVD